MLNITKEMTSIPSSLIYSLSDIVQMFYTLLGDSRDNGLALESLIEDHNMRIVIHADHVGDGVSISHP